MGLLRWCRKLTNNFKKELTMEKKSLIKYYRTPAFTTFQTKMKLAKLREICPQIANIITEFMFLIESERKLNENERGMLAKILSLSYEPEKSSFNTLIGSEGYIVQTGPKRTQASPWSVNMVEVLHRSGLRMISRAERIARYKLVFQNGYKPSKEELSVLSSVVYDFMREEIYAQNISSFETNVKPKETLIIPVLSDGLNALKHANESLGANLNDFQLGHLVDISKKYQTNPTDVFLFQCAQGISEHSRHPHFNGRQKIDGELKPFTLMEMIKSTVFGNEGNSIAHFDDNSSVIEGFDVAYLQPSNPIEPSAYIVVDVHYDNTYNGETHNYPTTVCSIPGAETGTGGRVRDNLATGRGGLIIAGTTAFMVGNLFIPGYDLPWEIKYGEDPQGLEKPLDILIGAHTGAYDYGNKIGEAVINGSTRSFEMMLENIVDGKVKPFWSGYRKTIMFTGGIGQIRKELIEKRKPEEGMIVIRFGGDSYPVGIGGGSRSSDDIKLDEKQQEFDQSGVQRGDAIMEKLGINVVRACVELGENNPIELIHDSGAGGASNVIPESVYPAGANIYLNRIPMGDKTMSQLEYWTNECQEVNIVLVKPENERIFMEICKNHSCPAQVVGEVTGDGVFTLYDERDDSVPVKFEMEDLLGKGFPQATKEYTSTELKGNDIVLPHNLTVREALERVLRLIDVGSKRALINKVDRSVSGLIAQQQTVGPCQLPLSDYAIVANSMLQNTGAAISIGEQPIIGLIDPRAMVRMSIAEALLNLAGAKITKFEDINFCGNWMWAVKIPGEGVRIFNAVEAVTDFLKKIGLRINSGKDSLSMSCETMVGELLQKITAPGTFIASAYTTMQDIRLKVTPDIKLPGRSYLMHLNLAKGKARMGGSVLGRVYNMLGDTPPDIDKPEILVKSFLFIQELVSKGFIIAYHDVSDGGLIVTLLEMAFAGNCGLDICYPFDSGALRTLFNQEAGVVFEMNPGAAHEVLTLAKQYNLYDNLRHIGFAKIEKEIVISDSNQEVLREDMRVLRDIWEETGFKIDEVQSNPETVQEEREAIYDRKGMNFNLSFIPRDTPKEVIHGKTRPRVAILRERGSNTDREMANSFYQAGFEPWDVDMNMLREGKISLDIFKMICGVGGFSDSDVPEAGIGWASGILHHPRVSKEFENYFERPDTLSFWECNGAQVAPLIGILPWPKIPWEKRPRYVWGRSQKFESRFVSVKILEKNNSVFLKGMENSVLGIWVANGEGKLHFPDQELMDMVIKQNLSPIRYVDDEMNLTNVYPFNPSGGFDGMCSLSSQNGRHFSLMPHIVRSTKMWQWAYVPYEWRDVNVSPWVKFLQNGYDWCLINKDS